MCSVFVAAFRLFLVVVRGGYSLVAVQGLLIAVAHLVAKHGLEDAQTSVVAACRLTSCVFLLLKKKKKKDS